MNFSLKSFCVFLLILSVAFIVDAQSPSRADTQPLVLEDMSQRTGETITINSISSHRWFYGTYDYVHSLGCPLAPTVAPSSGAWQRFEMTYAGFVYIYLVSDNLESLILCNEPQLPTSLPPTSTQNPTIATSTPNVANNAGQFGGGVVDSFAACPLAPRLTVGGRGSVTPGDPNWVHSNPNRSATKIGDIPGEGVFNILAEPVCDSASGRVYWYVDYEGLVGWTAEGLNDDYWLQPVASGFNIETVNSVSVPLWMSSIQSDQDVMISLSPDSGYIAVAIENNVRLYGADGTLVSNVVADGDISVLTFTSSSDVVFGTETGQVAYVYNGSLRLDIVFSHESAIRDILSSEDETLLIVAEENGTISFWNIADNTVPLRVIQLGDTVGSLEFSDDQTTLIIRDTEGYLIAALTTQ